MLGLTGKNFGIAPYQMQSSSTLDQGKRSLSICVQGRRVDFCWENTAPIVRVHVLGHKIVQIRSENLPRELYQLPSPEAYFAFVKHSQLYLKQLNNGDLKLDINGRLRGGGHFEEAQRVFDWMQNQPRSSGALEDAYLSSDFR